MFRLGLTEVALAWTGVKFSFKLLPSVDVACNSLWLSLMSQSENENTNERYLQNKKLE